MDMGVGWGLECGRGGGHGRAWVGMGGEVGGGGWWQGKKSPFGRL